MNKSLKIAWATPWNPQSAITTFSRIVIEALEARGVEVEVLRLESSAELPPLTLRSGKAPRFVHEAPAADLMYGYDAVFVNIGNYYSFHAYAFDLLHIVPCVVVLHDADLSDIAESLCRLDNAVSMGAGIADAAAKTSKGGISERSSHLINWIGSFSSGGIVHSQHYAEKFRFACPGEVDVLPLAYPDLENVPPWTPKPGKLTVATIGMANPNKRIPETLQALALLPRSVEVHYKVLGQITEADRMQLDSLAGSLGISTEFTGWVDDAELARQLEAVDVIGCLRYPLSEGASASLIVGMRSGRPVAVSNHGSYADVPDEFVLKCRPGHEATDLIRHFNWILQFPGKAQAMAERAQAFARVTYSAESYADHLLGLIPQAAATQPMVVTGAVVGQVLAGLKTREDDPLIVRLSHNMAEMLGEA